MDYQIWSALKELAEVLRESSVVAAFSDQLPRNASQAKRGVPGKLQSLEATQAPVSFRPLTLASTVRRWESMPLLVQKELLPSDSEWNAWVHSARRVEAASRNWLAWIRSRMPGYPFVVAPPQLSPGCPLTTAEFSFSLRWQDQERRQALQRQGHPPRRAVGPLGLSDADVADFVTSTVRVGRALRSSDAWQNLNEVRGRMDPSSKAALAEARRRLAKRLEGPVIDKHATQRALSRAQYRGVVLQDEIDRLDGAARVYAESFALANELMDLSFDIVGQLMVYGMKQATGLEVSETSYGSALPTVIWEAELDGWPDMGALCRLDDPLIPDVVRLEGIEVFNCEGNGDRVRVRARILVGTATS